MDEKVMIVALDLSSMDQALIDYAGFMYETFDITKVVFVHNIKIPELGGLYEELTAEVDLKMMIRNKVYKNVENSWMQKQNYDIVISENSSTEHQLLSLEKKFKQSILLLGWKIEEKSTRGLVQKMVRLSQHAVYLIPEQAQTIIENVLIASDFSAPLQKHILRVFKVPSAFFPFVEGVKAIERTKRHIEEESKSKFRKYKFSDKWNLVIENQEDSWVSAIIQNYYEKKNMDMMLMSAKGANKLSKLYIGNVTNDIIFGAPFGVVAIIK